MKTLFSTAYWPCLEQFSEMITQPVILIEAEEHFRKQTYRNRCSILSANGKLDLVIPVEHAKKLPIKDVRIAYKEKWQLNHWRAITSAYGKSPYFEYFEDDLRVFYEKRTEKLLEFNDAQWRLLMKIFRLNVQIERTTNYQEHPNVRDLRNAFDPKKSSGKMIGPYTQVFSSKMDFVAGLSVLDLLFCKGPQGMTLLR